MKNLRISLISLVLGLALGSTTAWAAESVMTLISTGEALQKEVLDNKAKAESTDKANHDLAAEGKELAAANSQLNADINSMTNDANSVKQRTADYQNRCGPDKKL